MRFLADINVSTHVVAGLCAAGFDFHRVAEVMSCRAKDVEIVAEARRQGAVIVSYDQDFTAILATSGATQSSLINLRVSYVDAARLVREIAAVVRATESALATGTIVTLDDAGARVHQLPIG